MHTSVERELELTLVLSPEHSVPVPARLVYRADDPYAVHVTFHIGSSGPVHWTFARELLVEGARRSCGEGDVRVWPVRRAGGGALRLALSSPEGEALLEAPAGPVAAWVERTLRLVPPGRESAELELDAALGALFSEEPGA
ncbi:SsgA family sporulation/cell division regulator [Streptomyces sp. TRM 70351]|uniref:SsgA family sporulation/cell division regulator n=1 Tax=Streptomyces sp. TRM 70351 TaxID=3116552 RepID=UPI002E7B7AA1|nr:SsgA family sporulation/cell division regulator [Streptomyces sp. TRM 70351]MEE1928116.1 SsgA family sporulation/cell division regulator [Streptomyces sp. TRM 70351]